MNRRTFGALTGPTLLLVLFGLTACDSSDNGNDDFTAVSGEYVFTRFEFTPDSPLLQPVNMLDTLVVSETRLQLFDSGRFTLLYRFKGQQSAFIGGSYSVSSNRVRLNGAADEISFYEKLLLSNEVTLSRAANRALTADIDRSVNLEKFSSRYKGLPSVDGTLLLRLKAN